MYDKNVFAENLKRIISQRGTTQREVAEKLGVTETTVSRYVTTGPKGRTPNVESLVALAQVLNVSLDTLVGVEPPATARQAPDVKILLSAYEKAAIDQREAIWSMMNAFQLLTTEQKLVVDAVTQQEKAEAI
jgi:transcriptional regulator with XRE-family HTH domain